jgi:hypothetical protein
MSSSAAVFPVRRILESLAVLLQCRASPRAKVTQFGRCRCGVQRGEYEGELG